MIAPLLTSLQKAELLTEAQQVRLAELVDDFLASQALLNSPLGAMAMQALEDDKKGLTIPLDDVLRELENHWFIPSDVIGFAKIYSEDYL